MPSKVGTFTISGGLRGRNVVEDTDLTPGEIGEVLETATRLKRRHKWGEPHPYLAGKTLGMLFQRPSTRTRAAFEAGMAQLGGYTVSLGVDDFRLKCDGERITDTGRVLSRYVDAVVARVASHTDLVELASVSSVPVLNGQSDKCHPLRALSDLLTLQDRFGALAGLKLAYLCDGTNVAPSLLLAGAAMGVHVSIASPAGYGPHPAIVAEAAALGATSGAKIAVTNDPWAAVKDADAVYTDVHVGMGLVDGPARAVALAPYRVTTEMLAAAKLTAVFMHGLPMHRGEEVDADVAEGPQSVVFDQAENRLHLHKALLAHTLC